MFHVRKLFVLFALLVLWTPASAGQAPSTEDILAKVRQALGHDRLTQSPAVEVRGSTTHYGLKADYRLTFNRRGHFRVTVDGPVGEIRGFDGSICWSRDWSGSTRRFELEDRELALTAVWVETGHWLARPAPFDVDVAADAATDKELTLSLHLRGGQLRSRLVLDRTTWRPIRLLRTVGKEVQSWEYDDYRPALGGLLPHKITQKAGGVEQTVSVESVNAVNVADPEVFRFAPQAPNNVTFDPKQPAAIEVKRTKTGHLLVHPLVNGEDVGWFIFDSGAGIMVLDKAVADRLKSDAFGQVPARGIGGTVTTRFRKDRFFQLGPLTLRENLYVELDLRFLGPLMGETIAGIVGYQAFQAAVVELDCATPAVSLHDPMTYKLPRGRWQELVVANNHPCFRARFDKGEGLFRLDTGSTNTISFHAPAVERLKLLENRETNATQEGGVGGFTTSRQGALDWFEMGGHRFEKPQVTFSQATTGALMDEHTVGNLGQGFLKEFRVVFWYQTRKIAFVKKP